MTLQCDDGLAFSILSSEINSQDHIFNYSPTCWPPRHQVGPLLNDDQIAKILAPGKIPLGSKSPQKCIYSVAAQEMAKHRTKFGWPPMTNVGAVTKPRRETRWNLLGYPKPANRSQPLVGWLKLTILWGYVEEIAVYEMVPIVDRCLTCEDIARQTYAMVRKWRIFASCISASRVQHISHLHCKFALRHIMWGSMVHIQLLLLCICYAGRQHITHTKTSN